ncbi:hypothetical protein [Pelagibacterium sp.]|uniref:hypothetical protein n=1 Tax=Pelagibacterium sp. TaxID=1967288 RepID=UPI003BAB1080
MDVEKEQRAALVSALGAGFECFEEVPLQHALFTRRTIRADILAVPKDDRLASYAFAFEVKQPDTSWDYSAWAQAIRQATDYVYASIQPSGPAAKYAGRRISAAFKFPAPPVDPEGRRVDKGPYVRPDTSVMVTGVFHLALHLRVGRAYWEDDQHGRRFRLDFGPNPVWCCRRGFRNQGINLVAGKRTLGSQRIEIRNELDGWGSTVGTGSCR